MKKTIVFLWAVFATLTAVSAYVADILNISFDDDLKKTPQPQATDQLHSYMLSALKLTDDKYNANTDDSKEWNK